MKHAHFLMTPVWIFLLCSTNVASQEKPVLMLNSYPLKKAQEKILIKRALDGSSSAAKELYKHYVLLDLDKALYWAIIGSENGDPYLQYNAAELLHVHQSCNDQRRGLFWLHKSAANGFHVAIEALKDRDLSIDKDCKK